MNLNIRLISILLNNFKWFSYYVYITGVRNEPSNGVRREIRGLIVKLRSEMKSDTMFEIGEYVHCTIIVGVRCFRVKFLLETENDRPDR